MCDITGRDYYHQDEGSKSFPINNQDDNSSAKTLNFNDGNNIIVLLGGASMKNN